MLVLVPVLLVLNRDTLGKTLITSVERIALDRFGLV